MQRHDHFSALKRNRFPRVFSYIYINRVELLAMQGYVVGRFVNSVDGFFMVARNIDAPHQRHFNVADHRRCDDIAIKVQRIKIALQIAHVRNGVGIRIERNQFDLSVGQLEQRFDDVIRHVGSRLQIGRRFFFYGQNYVVVFAVFESQQFCQSFRHFNETIPMVFLSKRS